MHHSMSTVHGANICMWLKRDLRFDPAKEQFVNDTQPVLRNPRRELPHAAGRITSYNVCYTKLLRP